MGKRKPPILWKGGKVLKYERLIYVGKDSGNKYSYNFFYFFTSQFEIVGLDRYVEDNPHYGKRFTINNRETYARILIKRK